MWTSALSIIFSISYFISPWFKNVLDHDINPDSDLGYIVGWTTEFFGCLGYIVGCGYPTRTRTRTHTRGNSVAHV